LTLDDLEKNTGICLHDAILLKMDIDYENRELHLKLRIYVHGPEDPDDAIYRTAVVTLSGLFFCVIEPPDSRIARIQSGELVYDHGTPYVEFANLTIVDSVSVKDSREPPTIKLPETESEGAFTNCIFVREWNASMWISAIEASLIWLDEVASS
jgi:hypothetical protein